ncbi:hypothetical protein CHS0354_008166 [Potamilus streckersoni]|uniref:Cornifelin n=1 Tax=Potamilus streckersoni TaxID=2493646 RepID=A0AAE0SII7_9BIVA|nr:hypothetical protein CHS0354_008166 [Potamilus streckersoni]
MSKVQPDASYPQQPVQYHYGQPGYSQPQTMQPSQHFTNTNNTTVIINQQPQVRRGPRDWSTGLCGCLEDVTSCLLTWCCTPYYSCYLAMELGESCCLPLCFGPGECMPSGGYPVPWLVALRVKVREANKIQGSIMGDCCAVCCCPLCVMCQLKREHNYVKLNPVD